MTPPTARVIVVPLVLVLSACASSGRTKPRLPEAAAWAASPVRWLLLPEETTRLVDLRTAGEFAAFRERFWQRRSGDPGAVDDSALATYLERVAIADRLYAEPGLLGSQTPRGRALIVLGPPSLLRSAPRTLGPSSRRRSEVVETWGYRRSDLAPAIAAELGPAAEDGTWTIAFVVRDGRGVLLAGEERLAAAARGWLGR